MYGEELTIYKERCGLDEVQIKVKHIERQVIYVDSEENQEQRQISKSILNVFSVI